MWKYGCDRQSVVCAGQIYHCHTRMSQRFQVLDIQMAKLLLAKLSNCIELYKKNITMKSELS